MVSLKAPRPHPVGFDVVLGRAGQVEEPAGESRRGGVPQHRHPHPLGGRIGLDHQLGGLGGESAQRGPELDGAALGYLRVAGRHGHREHRRRGRLGPRNEDRLGRIAQDRRSDHQEQRGGRGLAAAAALLITVGPPVLRDAARVLFVPWSEAAAAPVFAVQVIPGNATVPRGGALEIRATLRNFAAEGAELVLRADTASEWVRIPMVRDSAAAEFTARLFDLTSATEYYAEANEVRSRIFKLTIADLPAVRKFSLELRFPAYTGLPVERIEEGGDVAAVRGTTVTVRATTSRAVQGGSIRLDDGTTVQLAADSAGRLVGIVSRGEGRFLPARPRRHRWRRRPRRDSVCDRSAGRSRPDRADRRAGARHQGHLGGRGHHRRCAHPMTMASAGSSFTTVSTEGRSSGSPSVIRRPGEPRSMPAPPTRSFSRSSD